VQDHKPADCPNKDKCYRCGASGHFACNCTNAWGTAATGVNPSLSEQASGQSDPVPGQTFSGQGDPAPEQTSVGYTSLPSITGVNMASPRAVAADPSKGDPLLVPLGVPPAVQETLSGDCSEVSPSDAYLFTCGQPMSEDVASDVVEVSYCRCISAEASLAANLNVERSEDCDVETGQ